MEDLGIFAVALAGWPSRRRRWSKLMIVRRLDYSRRSLRLTHAAIGLVLASPVLFFG
jgi:hypothetical protein